MTLAEKAEQFALEALKEQIEKVKQAYIAGYKECEENYKKITVDENGLTWYDLDLPSGNLWSEPLKDEDGELIQCNYNSVKHLNLPTIGDLKELRIYTRNHTSDDFDNYHYYCRKSENTDKYLIPVGHRFWLKEKIANSRSVPVIVDGGRLHDGTSFIGDLHAVILIKRK